MIEGSVLPPAVQLVRDFVNTYEPQTRTESLIAPDRLRLWLTQREQVPTGPQLSTSDLAVVIALREGLRAVLLGHAGQHSDPAAVQALNHALAEVPVRLVFTADGHHFAAAGSTALSHALAPLVEAIRQCSEDHTWARLKVCARHTCQWAFYDASRNQARRWCSMTGCGNHIKMQRAYAARRRRTAQGDVSAADGGGRESNP